MKHIAEMPELKSKADILEAASKIKKEKAESADSTETEAKKKKYTIPKVTKTEFIGWSNRESNQRGKERGRGSQGGRFRGGNWGNRPPFAHFGYMPNPYFY